MLNINKDLTIEEQFFLMNELKNREKKIFVAYLAWYILGLAGAHRFYIGKIKSGLLMVVTFLVGLVSFFIFSIMSMEHFETIGFTLPHFSSLFSIMVLIGVFIFLIDIIWWLIDIFLLHKKVKEYNHALEMEITSEIRQGRRDSKEDGDS